MKLSVLVVCFLVAKETRLLYYLFMINDDKFITLLKLESLASDEGRSPRATVGVASPRATIRVNGRDDPKKSSKSPEEAGPSSEKGPRK